jgi:hypothetical protein
MPTFSARDGTELAYSVQGAGHYSWLDVAGWFVRAVTAFLDGR